MSKENSNEEIINTKVEENSEEEIVNSKEEPANENISQEQVSAIVQQPSDIKNMETHAQELHKAPGSGWKHYFFEFFMLFLAVFSGFLAENWREHIVERERAKELAETLYKEIYADSVSLQKNIALRNTKESECSYFIDYVKDSSLTILSPHFYPAFTWAFIQSAQLSFEPNDGILNQLRNSGELRYFKSRALQSKIGEITVRIANLRTRNAKEYGFIEFYLRPFSIKHYDFSWYEKLTQHGGISVIEALNNNTQIPETGKIINADKFNRQEAENTATYFLLMLRGTRQTEYVPYSKINHELLEILRKEYPFNNE